MRQDTWIARIVWEVPIILGPAIAGCAILATHLEGMVYKPQQYIDAPPTISRLLTDPAISKPFALAMIASAVFLTGAILQVARSILHFLHLSDERKTWRLSLLGIVLVSELVAVAGMVVLSQYTGNIDPKMHDRGSYMLFFGHAIGITLAGVLVRDLLERTENRPLSSGIQREVELLRQFPSRSVKVFGLSVLYGVVYFGGKVMPDSLFFVCRAVLSVLEVIVIFSFLGFLMGFRPVLRARSQSLSQENLPRDSISATTASPSENTKIHTVNAER